MGDLAFFYDMNVLGNRHVGRNVRILLVNNGKGTEFRNYNHPGATFGDEADKFIAAAGHYGNKSHTLVRHYAEDLGYEYLSASNKEEFNAVYKHFITSELTEHSMIFEVFTTNEDESNALKIVNSIEVDTMAQMKSSIKKSVSNMLGKDKVQGIKLLLK